MVEAGYRGVTFNLFTGIDQDVLDEGLHAHWPWESVMLYPVSTETVSFDKKQGFSVLTADGKKVQMDVLLSYHLEADKLPGLMARFRQQEWSEVSNEYLRVKLVSVIQSVTVKYSVVELYEAKRQAVASEIETVLARELKKEGIHIEDWAINDLRVDSQTQQLLQKLVESNIREQYILNETENKKRLASQKQMEAEARRKAILTEAKAEAEANRLVSQTLTPAFMRYQEMMQAKETAAKSKK